MSAVEKFYDQNTQREWERAERHRTEFAVTLCAFGHYLPPPPATIYDIGGGPGRYSIALAQQGYTVTLVDLSQGCLDFARHKAQKARIELANLVHASATDLQPLGNAQCDAALLMGPLYHLLKAEERHQAISETARVLRPGGLIFAAFITRYAVIRWAAKNDPLWLVQHRQEIEQMLATGVHIAAPEDVGFTDAYFAYASEIAPLLEQAGFETLALVGCEGVVSQIEEQINTLEGKAWQVWVELNYELGQDPAAHGAVEHLLYVGKKR